MLAAYLTLPGALPEHQLGECHNPETHVIPLLLRAAMDRKPFAILEPIMIPLMVPVSVITSCG